MDTDLHPHEEVARMLALEAVLSKLPACLLHLGALRAPLACLGQDQTPTLAARGGCSPIAAMGCCPPTPSASTCTSPEQKLSAQGRRGVSISWTRGYI